MRKLTGLEGGACLSAIRLSTPDNDEVMPCAGLFSLIGAEPSSDWRRVPSSALDDNGFGTDRPVVGSMPIWMTACWCAAAGLSAV